MVLEAGSATKRVELLKLGRTWCRLKLMKGNREANVRRDAPGVLSKSPSDALSLKVFNAQDVHLMARIRPSGERRRKMK